MTDPATTTLTVRSPQGGDLEVLVTGPEDGTVLLYHSGTPSGAVPFPLLWRAAERQGVRVVTYSRPGYGASTPREVPGTLADDVADSAAVLDAVGAGDFVTLGWSGAGRGRWPAPRCCRSGARPPPAWPASPRDGPRTSTGSPAWARRTSTSSAPPRPGPRRSQKWLTSNGAPALAASAAEIADSLGDLVPDVDRAAMTGEFADYLAASFHQAGRQGVRGWRDDDLLLLEPWPFDIAAIGVPVAVWQGEADRMVPFDHGRWLVDRLANPVAHLEAGEGHISLVAQVDRILAELLTLAD